MVMNHYTELPNTNMSLHILYAGDQHQGRALTFNPACDDMFWPLFLFFSCDDYNQNNFGCNSNHIFLKGSTIEDNGITSE